MAPPSDKQLEGAASDDVRLPQCPMVVPNQTQALIISVECPPRGIPSRQRAKGEKEGALRTRGDGSFDALAARAKVNVNQHLAEAFPNRTLEPSEGSGRDRPIKKF